MGFWNKRGSATVFLCIVMPALIGGLIMLTDAYIKHTGKKIVEAGVESSAYSVLGGYSGYLKDKYDIYAFGMEDFVARDIASQCLLSNLDESGFFRFRVENVSVVFSKGVVEQGILTAMIERTAADDAYGALAVELKDRLGSMAAIPDFAGIIGIKMQFDETLMRFRNAMSSLDRMINGNGGSGFYINSSEIEGKFTDSVAEFAGYCELIRQVALEIKSMAGKGVESDGTGFLLEEKAGRLREMAARLYEDEIEVLAETAKDVCEEAIRAIEEIFVENVNIHIISDTLKRKVESMDGCPGYIREILRECLEIAEYAEEVLVEQAFEEIRSQIYANLEYIEAIVLDFNIFVDSDPTDGIPAGPTGAGAKYNSDLNFTYSMEEAGKGFDARAFFEAMGKKILEKRTGRDVVIETSCTLPSELSKWMPGGGGGREFAVDSTGESTESAQREFEGFSDAVSSVADTVFFELIFNEYILSHCSFETSADENRYETGNFFRNEVEYILWGSKSQNLNCFYTKSALMTARFALNAIHVYSDSEKKLKADALAAATAGWWTAGAGIPVMSNLIKCSWAIAEAGIDAGKLFSGDEIAVIKRSADWITDIGLKSAGIKTPGILCMDYRDYLRLFLMGVPEDIKAARLLDIIALDAPGDFNIFGAFTEVCVEATVTFRSIAGGRHEVKIKVMRSY